MRCDISFSRSTLALGLILASAAAETIEDFGLGGLGNVTSEGARAFKCLVPANDKVTNFAWDRSGEDQGGPYFPLSSLTDLAIEQKMLGTAAAKCVRMKWSNDEITVLEFYGDPQKPTHFSCKQMNPPKNAWDCMHLRAKDDPLDLSHRAWVTMTDNHTYSFTYRCFTKLGMDGWVVFTTAPTISLQLKKKCTKHAANLGLPSSLTDIVERSYSMCEKFYLP